MLRPIDRWFIDHVLPFEPQFLRVAGRMSADREEAADLVHEAYAELLELKSWASVLDVKAYTIKIIRNRGISRVRRAKVVQFRQLTAVDVNDLADADPDAFRMVSARDEVSRAMAALDNMPERCRTAVVRCRIEEQSPRSVATTLGVSLSTLEKRLARGLHLLAEALGRHDEPVHADTGQWLTTPAEAIDHGRRSATG